MKEKQQLHTPKVIGTFSLDFKSRIYQNKIVEFNAITLIIYCTWILVKDYRHFYDSMHRVKESGRGGIGEVGRESKNIL